jgi:hypothetical protein
MDKILSRNLQAVANQGCHLEGLSPYMGTAYRGVYCIRNSRRLHKLVSLARGITPVCQIWLQTDDEKADFLFTLQSIWAVLEGEILG